MRSRKLRWIVGSLLGIVMLGGWASGVEPVNVLRNGGFEEGFAGWIPAPEHELIKTRGTARTGDVCLAGEVTSPNTHLSLRQSVTVKADNRYEFQVAACGTNRTKLVLWAREPQRRMIASWEKLTPEWRLYRTPLSLNATGEIELELIAPSAHNAPPGKIWLDDIALLETKMPPLTSVSDDEGFNDEPAIAHADDGSLYAAWNSFRDLADSLQIARFKFQDDGTLARAGAWQVLGEAGKYLMGIQVIPAGTQVYVVYAAEIDTNWDVYAVVCDATGPGEPVRISRDPSVDANPSAAWRDGRLWTAWESNREGFRQILVAQVQGDAASQPEPLSDDAGSSYDPSVAVLDNGEVCVAWHSFRDSNYDIYLRRRSERGKWEGMRRLTHAPSVDRHARLVANQQELLLAYENAQVEGYYVGRTDFRRIMLARVQDDGLWGLKGYQNSPLWGRCEAPSLSVDRSGRLWVAYLRPRPPRTGWDTYLTCYDGKRWMEPQPLSIEKGMDRRPALTPAGLKWAVAFQSDNLPRSWSDVDLTPTAKSNIMVASYDPGALPAAASLAWEPLVEPDETFEAAELRIARGEECATPTIDYQGQALKLFYGDLHQHSAVSVCNRLGDQSIEEDYQFSRDINRLDFACSTDHGYNINSYLWMYTGKLARIHEDPSRYLTFLAEEWTSTFEETSAEHPYGFYGHRNLILGNTYFPRWWNARNRQTPAEVWEDLRKMKADFVHIPHQLADTGNVPTDWNFSDEQAQPVAEIFQVRGSYEYKGTPREAGRSTPPGYFLQDAWARGVVIGVIASPDHGGGYGKACVFAPELTRKSILASLRDRRCFGTTGARIFLDVRVNDHLMGEKVDTEPTGTVTVKIKVRCPMEIDRIEVCRSNRFVYIREPDGKEAELTFVDRDPVKGRSYYYVRVIQEDEEIAWSSPVWFGSR